MNRPLFLTDLFLGLLATERAFCRSCEPGARSNADLMRTTKEQEPDNLTPQNTLLESGKFWLNGTALTAILTLAIWATTKLNGIDAKLDSMAAQSLVAWKVGQEQEALYQLRIRNPSLVVPDAWEIHSRIK